MDDSPTDSAALRVALVEVATAANRLIRVAARSAGDPESPAIWRTLSVLTTTGPMRLGELAAESRVSQPTMTKLVRGLEDQGWTRRVADPADARAVLIAATDSGSAALEDWRERIGEAMLPLFADLPADDVAVLARAAVVIHERIARQIAPRG